MNKKQIIHKLVKKHKGATEIDRKIVCGILKSAPSDVLYCLQFFNIKIIVCRDNITEYFEELKGIKPRGWRRGIWEECDGIFSLEPGENPIVVVSTFAGSKDRRCAYYNTVLHEVGHAFDYLNECSDSVEFNKVRDKDFKALTPYERQKWAAGRQETFAECFMMYFCFRKEMKKERKNLFKYFYNKKYY